MDTVLCVRIAARLFGRRGLIFCIHPSLLARSIRHWLTKSWLAKAANACQTQSRTRSDVRLVRTPFRRRCGGASVCLSVCCVFARPRGCTMLRARVVRGLPPRGSCRRVAYSMRHDQRRQRARCEQRHAVSTLTRARELALLCLRSGWCLLNPRTWLLKYVRNRPTWSYAPRLRRQGLGARPGIGPWSGLQNLSLGT